FAAQGRRRGRLHRGRDLAAQRLAQPLAATGGAVVIERLVERDLPQPVVDAALLPGEALDALERRQKGVLEQILGLGALADAAEQAHKQRVGVLGQHRLERRQIAALRTLNRPLLTQEQRLRIYAVVVCLQRQLNRINAARALRLQASGATNLAT